MSHNETINDTTNTWTQVKKAYVPKPKPRCRFGVACTKGGDACNFEHPECRNGTTCPKKGNGCAFRHLKTKTPPNVVVTPAVVGSVFQQMATFGDDDVDEMPVLKKSKPVLKENTPVLKENTPVKEVAKPVPKETWASRLSKPAPVAPPVPVVPPAPLKSKNFDDASSIQSDSTSSSSVSKKLDF